MPNNDPPKPTHVAGTQKGEELVFKKGREPGRNGPIGGPRERHKGTQPYRTARDSTAINPQLQAPIDPRMPHIPPP